MNPFLSLLTAGLVAINQYIPLNHGEHIRHIHDIKDLKKEDIFPSANQSCQYLISAFIEVGLEQVLGDIAGQSFGDLLKEELNKENFLDQALNSLMSEPYSKQIQQYGLNPETAVLFIKKLCDKDFSPLHFSPEETQAVFDFIQSEIHILKAQDFKKIPLVPFFGNVPLTDRNHQDLGSLYSNSRSWINYNEMSNHLILSLISAEDQSFFEHNGVDTHAVARLAKQITQNGAQTGGGSTLTMQLLKNLYFNKVDSNIDILNNNRGSVILRKVREWYWAKEFEKAFQSAGNKIAGKKKILEHYLNLFNFGYQIQGIHQASQVYFSKKPHKLSLSESAYITTLFKGPYLYSNPLNYSQYTQPRRDDYVLNQVANTCSKVLNSTQGTQNTEVQKIFKNLCKEGKNPIDLSYIENEKTKALPLWEEPPSRLEEFLIPIHRQAKRWLNQTSFEDSYSVQEISLQTTIDKNLQKILFDITREYLDEQDQKRNILDQIQPARNDKGKKAQISMEHLPVSLKQKLDNLIKPLQKKDIHILYSLRLSPNPHSNSLDESFIHTFFKNDFSSSKINQVLEKIKKNLLKTNIEPGSLTFIKLTKSQIILLKLDSILKELSISSSNPITKELSALNIKNELFKQALAQMFQNRSRDYLEPALYLGQGVLVDKNLNRVSLSASSKQHLLQNTSYQAGDFFWIKGKPNQTYSLQREKLQAAVIILDSHSGETLASFDGYNSKNNFFYRSNQSKRQPGSTIKAFTYLYTLGQKDFHPQTLLNNEFASIPISQTEIYEPKNFSDQFGAQLALFKAFIHSQNIATINLIQHPFWGPDWKSNLNELNHFFEDIELYPREKLSKTLYPSVVLGSKEITLTQLSGAFSWFANSRFIATPHLFKKVSNYKNQELYYFVNKMNSPHLDKPHALFQMQTLLLSSANIGTAARLNSFLYRLKNGKYRDWCYNNLLHSNYQSCLGGKTGTSNDNHDLWFIGFSKNFIIGIWVGYDVPESVYSQSSQVTLPLFEAIVQKGLKYLPPLEPIISPEDQPPVLVKRQVSGSQACSNTNIENHDWIYVEEDSPVNECVAPVDVDKKCICEEALLREKDSKGRVIKESKGYTLDIFYNNKLYENNDFYNSLQECQSSKKHYINSKTQEPVCPL